MSDQPQNKKIPTFVFIIIGVLVIAVILFFALKPAAPAQPAPTEVTPATEVVVPTKAVLPPTATATPLPTATQEPSPTATPALAVADPALTVWCYPTNLLTAPPSSAGLANPPADVNLSSTEGEDVFLTIPNYSCNYVFHFNQKAPEGLKVEIYDWLQKQAIFNLAVDPAGDDPNAAVLATNITYLTSPPLWQYTYKFVLKNAAGSELLTQNVTLDKGWRPDICLAGVLPNPKTLRCPLRQDAHPWDPWYGKTPVPNDDEHPIP